MSAMSEMLSYGLLALVIGLAILIVYALSLLKEIQQESSVIRDQATLIHTQGEVQKEAIGNLDFAVKPEMISAGIGQSQAVIAQGIQAGLDEAKFGERIGAIDTNAAAILSANNQILTLFQGGGHEASGWAEIELEKLLKDKFSDVKIRKRVAKLDGAVPDAHLELSNGDILCIDSKFPLGTFGRMAAEPNGRKRKPLQEAFIKALRGHIDKVAQTYVKPEKGTTEVAYMYIGSEAGYHHLINPMNESESSLIRDAAGTGVIVCSPSTLMANMHLVRIAEQAMGISEHTGEIVSGHRQLRKDLDDLKNIWMTLMNQIKDSYNNRAKVQDAIDSLERIVKSLESLDLSGDED